MTKKESGLIIQFEDCEPNYEKDKLKVEKFFKFLIEIAREDYSIKRIMKITKIWQVKI